MPRFGAENVPNALQEQMYRDMMLKLMMDRDPLSGSHFMDVQQFGDFVPRPQGEMQRGSINEFTYDERPMQYDDTMTSQQRNKDVEAANERQRRSKMQTIRPEQYNDPQASQMDQPPPPSAFGFEGGNPMQNLYNELPFQGSPKYPMQVMPAPSYDQGGAMDQLLQFYSNEDI